MNTQLYPNSPLAGSSIADEAKGNSDALYNASLPNFGILHEKPEHRLIIMLKVQGHSNTEIARLTGYTIPWVGQVLRQPWARERILDELKAAGRDSIQALLEASTADSIFTIIELRDRSDDDSVRLRAADSLLDRYLGKATQRVETKGEVTHLTGDIAKLDEDINKLESEINRLTGQSASSVPLPTAAAQSSEGSHSQN